MNVFYDIFLFSTDLYCKHIKEEILVLHYNYNIRQVIS